MPCDTIVESDFSKKLDSTIDSAITASEERLAKIIDSKLETALQNIGARFDSLLSEVNRKVGAKLDKDEDSRKDRSRSPSS